MGSLYRFGKNPAAVTLSQILMEPEYQKYSTSVGWFYNDYTEGLKQFHLMSERRFQIRMALAWRNEFLNEAEKFPAPVCNFLKNCIKTKYKEDIHNRYPKVKKNQTLSDNDTDESSIWRLFTNRLFIVIVVVVVTQFVLDLYKVFH